MLSNLNIILIILILLFTVLGYIYIYKLYFTKKEKFTVTNAQMQTALSSASTDFNNSLTNLESLETKFKNLDMTMTKRVKTQASDIENLKKAIIENVKVVKAVDEKLAGKIKTISEILTGEYIVGATNTKAP